MKKESLKNIIAIVLMFCIVFVALFFYASFLQKKLDEDVRLTLKEITAQSVKVVYNEIQSEFNLIEEIAERLEIKEDFDAEETVDTLISITERYPFKRMGVILPDGTGYNTDNVNIDFSVYDFLDDVFSKRTVLTDTAVDQVDGEKITIYATPIIINGEVIAALYATYSIDNFRDLILVNSFEQQGYSYIVKTNGDSVIDSNNPISFVNMTNIFKSINEASDTNLQSCNELQEKMLEGESGYIIFNNKINKYLYYAPIGINDWYLMVVVPEGVAEQSVSSIMYMTYILCAVVAVLAVLFMMYIANIKKQRLKAVEDVLYLEPLTGGISYTKFCIDATISLGDNKGNAAFIALDFANFSLINEMCGSEAGNLLLKYIHDTLEKNNQEHEVFSRRVSDKFVALLYYNTKDELTQRLVSLCEEIQENQPKLVNEYLLKPSIGVYLINDYSESIERMDNLAVIAKDSINHKHEEYLAFYDDVYRDKLLRDKQLEDQMEIAERNNEFTPYFQPKYDTKTQKIIGAEALVRWKKPDGTIISPGVFIPLAEKNGFIARLDKHMFKMVCERQREMMDAGFQCVPISVNLSRTVLHNKSFIKDYEEILKEFDLPTHFVELEITESALFENQGEFKHIVDELHERGFKIHMDDFGVGYSSLMMLKSIPIDNMKLDKTFVDDYNDLKSREIIISVIKLAKSLDISVTAEGVETQEQYEFLKLMECGSIQGYYFAKPMPFDNFKEKLENNND